ncbi:MAG: hypothetical protein FWE03_05715 [Firmicutes bacterium]|nr:hypothetical protein [Bacillota bacterium]
MKRKTIILLVACIFAMFIFTTIACVTTDRDFDFDNEQFFSVNFLENFAINLDGVSALALASSNQTDTSAQTAQRNSNLIAAHASPQNQRSFLYAIDEYGNHNIVQFYNHTAIENNEILTQAEIPGEIDKMYISGDFVFLRFVSGSASWWNWERDQNRNFDRENFDISWNTHSFAVYMPTGHIYSLADIAGPMPDYFAHRHININIHDGNVICFVDWTSNSSNRRFYVLSIENDNLIATNLVPNPNIQVQSVMADRFGNIFVRNNTVNETDGNIVFYNHNNFYRGDDGYIYEIRQVQRGSQNHLRNITQIRRFNENRQLVDLCDNTNVFLRSTGWSNDRLLHGNFLLDLHFGNMHIHYRGPFGFENWTWFSNNHNNHDHRDSFLILDGNLFMIVADENNNRELVYVDLSTLTPPELEFQFRYWGHWEGGHWVDAHYTEGVWLNEAGNEVAEENAVFVQSSHIVVYDECGTEHIWGYHPNWTWIEHPAGSFMQDDEGRRLSWKHIPSFFFEYGCEDKTPLTWTGQRVEGYWNQGTFVHQFTEDCDEWNFFHFAWTNELIFDIQVVSRATSAFIQGGQLQVVHDTIRGREVGIVAFIDGEWTIIPDSSIIFAGTVITMRPLN